jgi:hypothetical protein
MSAAVPRQNPIRRFGPKIAGRENAPLVDAMSKRRSLAEMHQVCLAKILSVAV